ncbi:MAG: hypothetical protein ACI9XJ_000386 [Marivirga sp.]|jgi:hypothetical protein
MYQERIKFMLYHFSLLFCLSCEGVDEVFTLDDSLQECTNNVISSGKYYQLGERMFLNAHEDSSKHFDVTDWSLSACNLGASLNRESFEALYLPDYELLSNKLSSFQEDEEAVFVLADKGVLVFPLGTLLTHEVINEQVGDVAIMVVYCPLADLVSVYHRNYCDTDLMFAVSGFTYKEDYLGNELESFILWDRETESLWWPINEQGVSGVFQGEALKKYNSAKWGRGQLNEIVKDYPDALVIKQGQGFSEEEYLPQMVNCSL